MKTLCLDQPQIIFSEIQYYKSGVNLQNNIYSKHFISLLSIFGQQQISSSHFPFSALLINLINTDKLRYCLLKMGGNQSDQGESFKKEDWQIVQRTETSSTWQNYRDPRQRIQQFAISSSSQTDYNHERQMYYLRKNHPQVVAAHFLSTDTNHDFCSSTYQQKLYIQKIPIRLADIEHIPFPDYLHIYAQALKGYSYLATHFGYFAVQEDYIGINQKLVAKVWTNPDFSRSEVIGQRVTQQAMVRSILEVINKNIDHSQSLVPPLQDYIFKPNNQVTFQYAIFQFNNFLKQYYNGVAPQRLDCIDRVGGIYRIAHRDQSIIHQQGQKQPSQGIVVQTRPRLLDSQILKNLKYQSKNYNENHINMVQNSQFVPHPGFNPTTIPAARRQNYPIYNLPRIQTNLPPTQFFHQNNFIVQQRFQNIPRTNLIFNSPAYQPQNSPQQTLYLQRTNPIPYQNIEPIPRIQYLPNINSGNNHPSYINQPSPRINNNQIANNLNNMINNQNKIIINNNQPSIPFPRFQPPFPIVNPNQINTQINNTYRSPQIADNNTVHNNFDFGQKQTIDSIKSIHIDDGKSPSDFFSQLNSFNSMQAYKGVKYQPDPNQSINKMVNISQKYEIPLENRAVSQNISGRYNFNSSDDKQSLKLQNNLNTKYPVYQKTQVQFQPSYISKKYQTSFDPDLLRDLNQLRQKA